MLKNITLTVSESKRLIAKAVAQLPEVMKAQKDGLLVVSTGSTNAYVAEEILGNNLEKRGFLTGHYKPAKLDAASVKKPARISDLILAKGSTVEDKTKFEIIHEMGPGDIFIKGANALNYVEGVAGVAIGDPKGGTMGGVWGPITAKKIHLILPVGLEKLVAHDIVESWEKLNAAYTEDSRAIGLFPVFGKIITEIEAVEILFGIEARHVGSGGIFGAEGCTVLLLEGDSKKVDAAVNALKEIQGEPAF